MGFHTFLVICNETVRALAIFIVASLVFEFIREGLVSNVIDLHKIVIATIVLYGVKLLMNRSALFTKTMPS